MALEIYNGAQNLRAAPSLGRMLSSGGTSIFTLGDDGAVALDPWRIEAGTIGANLRIVGVPADYLYLDIHLAFTAAHGTDCALSVFGKVPRKQPLTARRWPYDFNSAVFDTDDSDLWVPLTDKNGAVVITLDDTVTNSVLHDTGTNYYIGPPSSVFLAGCTQVVAVPTVAHGTANSIILGRFVS